MTRRTRVVVADPPWSFGDKLPGPKRGAASHYACMSVIDVCNFLPDMISDKEIPPLADDAVLLLWRVNSQQREALTVVRAWGFDDPTSEVVWVKTGGEVDDPGDLFKPPEEMMFEKAPPTLRMGMGRTVRNCHEVALLCRRGKPVTRSHSERSVIFAPRGEHSAKPEKFYSLVERLYKGPYVELFARRRRDNWLQIGDELPPICSAVPPATNRRI